MVCPNCGKPTKAIESKVVKKQNIQILISVLLIVVSIFGLIFATRGKGKAVLVLRSGRSDSILGDRQFIIVF